MSNARRKRRTPPDPKVTLRITWRRGGRTAARLIRWLSRGRAERLAVAVSVREVHYRVGDGPWTRHDG